MYFPHFFYSRLDCSYFLPYLLESCSPTNILPETFLQISLPFTSLRPPPPITLITLPDEITCEPESSSSCEKWGLPQTIPTGFIRFICVSIYNISNGLKLTHTKGNKYGFGKHGVNIKLTVIFVDRKATSRDKFSEVKGIKSTKIPRIIYVVLPSENQTIHYCDSRVIKSNCGSIFN